MIVIRQGDVWCEVLQGKCQKISRLLTFKDPKAYHDPRFRYGNWDGKVRFFDLIKKRFPAGFLPRVKDGLRARGILYRVITKERKPVSLEGIEPKMLFGKTMRPDQVAVARCCVQVERGACDLATNYGKTILQAAIAKHLWEHLRCETLISVPGAGLAAQTAREIGELTGIPTGQLGGGKKTLGKITVATAASLATGSRTWAVQREKERRRPGKKRTAHNTREIKHNKKIEKLLNRVGAIFIDECHHAKAPSYRAFLEDCPARFRLGFSGTVATGKSYDSIGERVTEGYLGRVIKTVSNKTLIKSGVSARVYVFAITDDRMFADDLTAEKFAWKHTRDPATGKTHKVRVKVDGSDRYRKEEDRLIESPTYQKYLLDVCEAASQGKLKPLVLTHRRPHIESIRVGLKGRRLRPFVVHGEIPSVEREVRKVDFSRTPNGVLLASSVFNEGQNVPDIGAMVIAYGAKNVRILKQRVGRSLRKKKFGLNAIAIIDPLATNGHYLADHALERLAVYKREGFIVKHITDVREFCERLRGGWKSLLGEKRYERLLKEQRTRSQKEK